MPGEKTMLKESQSLTQVQTGKLNQRLLSGLVGIAGLIIWLGLWKFITGGAAQPFALATALFAAAAFTISEIIQQYYPHKIGATSFKVSGWLAVSLVIAAALSLGTFLPAGLAEFASPILGRFGGTAGFLVLAVVFSGLALVQKRPWLLDLGLGCGLAAGWLGPTVARQAKFPPPPTGDAILYDRLEFVFYIAAGLLLVAYVLKIRRKDNIYVRPLWRWSTFLTLLGLALVLFDFSYQNGRQLGPGGLALFLVVFGFVAGFGFLLLMQAVLVTIGRQWKGRAWKRLGIELAKYIGVVVLMLVATVLLYFATNEELEGVLLRNTLERKVAIFWRGVFGDERFIVRENGQMAGRITDEQGKPLAGANVIVSGIAGQPYTATTDAEGRYLIKDVPAGNHLPIAARFGYQDEVARSDVWLDSGRLVVTVRPGQTRQDVNFTMKTRPVPPVVTADKTLKITSTGEAFRDNPVPSPVLRSTFTFENDGKQIEGGIIHEPEAAKGNGPFPTLLIIYPGPANAWEGVSIPLAAQGYVVISYQPQRGIDLAGDMRDVAKLMAFAQAGLYSPRADSTRITVVGGSVSTVYAYLLLRDLESSPTRDRVKAAIMYGGLVDMYRFRYDWERGALFIDPGISELEDLLVAFGRPDNRPEHYLLFSTLYHLDKGALPSTLLVHAEKDTIVPVNQSQIIDQTMSRLGISHELLVYPNIEHYLDMSQRDPTQLDMLFKTIEFLKRNAAGN